MEAELIAPCGMNCNLCYARIRPRNKCLGGCRAPDDGKHKSCSNCKIVVCEKRNENGWQTCAPCDTLCKRIKDLDERYRTKFNMSMLENLSTIREHGMEIFLQQQKEKYRCSVCGETLSVHRPYCLSCKTPTR